MLIFFLLAAAAATCPLPASVEFALKRDLPPGAAEAFGEMAEKGEPFQMTDVLTPGARVPLARFVAARGSGCDLALDYEHGGVALQRLTAHLRFTDGVWTVASRRQAFQPNPAPNPTPLQGPYVLLTPSHRPAR